MNLRDLLGRLDDEVEPDETARRMAAGAILIDVREIDEWAAGHAIGARHIPLGQLGRHLATLPHDREVIFICRSGDRSATAVAMAKRAGLSKVANVRGGVLGWTIAGLPLEREGAA